VINLDDGWRAAKATDIVQGGVELTTNKSISTLEQINRWMTGVVPGTYVVELLIIICCKYF